MKARQMAFGGMMAALAVVIMCLTLIPVNTYVSPVLCILITRLVIGRCGKQMGWCYYAAVGILSLLLAPDKEAAVVYVFLGYYPIVKPVFDGLPKALGMIAKLVFFTLAGTLAYGLLLFVLGLPSLQAEFQDLGAAMGAVLLVIWDVLFILVDRLLSKRRK